MEHTNTKITRKEIIQIVFTVLLALAIGALIFTTITIVKKSELITTDPINYAIENSNIESCLCINDIGLTKTYGKEEETLSGEIGDLKLVKEK